MKKIITLMLAAGVIITAAFAQDHRHSYDSRYNGNSYQNQYPFSYQDQYPSYDGYSNYGSNWHRQAYGRPFGYNRYDRDWDRRMMYRHHRRHFEDYYRNRSGLSFQVVIGQRRTF